MFTLSPLNSNQANKLICSRESPHFLQLLSVNFALLYPTLILLSIPNNLSECDEITPLANYSSYLLFTPRQELKSGYRYSL